MSSTITKLNAPRTQAFGSQPSNEPQLTITPTINTQAQRLAEFDTLVDALEYASKGTTGYNFYSARGKLRSTLPYSTLQQNAYNSAQRLSGFGLPRGSRVAIIADTSPEFIELFFACRYAGLVPFAMPVPVNLGSHAVYVKQLRALLNSGKASIALANTDYIDFLKEAAEEIEALQWIGTHDMLSQCPALDLSHRPNHPDETAYLQFTSGSTRAPRGVIITERALMSNIKGIVRHGLEIRTGDRAASWLPFYHDMGLVGLVLAPMVAQLSVDYLATRDFAIRPMQWLRLISRNRCTIAFSQPFGLSLCTLRARESDLNELDLSCWRAAGIGAEMIKQSTLKAFAAKFAAVGFDENAFLPCYGLAETTLAITFSKIGGGSKSIRVDAKTLIDKKMAVQLQAEGRRYNEFVNCGRPLPGHAIKIVDEEDQELSSMMVGSVLVQGSSVMSGYFNNPEETNKALKYDNWLDTGDFGFLFEGDLYITGRRTDVIIVNGRNIRAQDVEELAEQQDEVRSREASAFSIVDTDGSTKIVLIIECRLTSVTERQSLISRLQQLVYKAFGVGCAVELVPRHTLPRTSSGKLSRFAARQGFIQRINLTDQLSIAESSDR